MPVSIVWFKRDLRVHDHAPLFAAAASGRAVLPLYVVEPALWQQPDASARQWSMVREALVDLGEALAALGSGLHIRHGDVIEVLDAIHRRHGIAEVHAHEETGNDWTFARDRRVAGWLRENGIGFIEHPNGSTVRRLRHRADWLPRWERHNGVTPLPPPPALLALASEAECFLPTANELGIAEDSCPRRQPGGRKSALRLLDGFISGRGANYVRGMSSPRTAVRDCSRLSVHFASGSLSIREALSAVRGAAESGAATPVRALRSFESRLHWQGHFMQKLESEPGIEFRPFHPGFSGLREEVDAVALSAWCRGETGWPFLDACMRQLQQTGWINFRMRAMLVAVASYHLWLPWRPLALHLARLFTDYEPGIHYPQVQMQAGLTGINVPRMYNPVKQGIDQDPQGDYVRRWIPALARLPAAWIHQPWRLPVGQLARYGVVLGRDYPLPLRDHEQAAREARAKLSQWWRDHPDMRETARRVLERHGSRMRRHRPRPATGSPSPGVSQGELF